MDELQEGRPAHLGRAKKFGEVPLGPAGGDASLWLKESVFGLDAHRSGMRMRKRSFA